MVFIALFPLWLICVAAFALSFFLCWLFWRFPVSRLQNAAEERSLHSGLIPRSGGLGIAAALVLAAAMWGAGLVQLLSPWWLGALLLLFSVSLADDFFSVKPFVRLLLQFLLALAIVVGGELYYEVPGLPHWILQGVTVLGLVWMINLYNFMDGMDGFAAGMALVGFSTFALLGWMQGAATYAGWNLCVAAAVAGFWCWNIPPARLFMGDSGSTVLGALAAIMGLLGIRLQLFPLWVAAVVFSPFWVDATYTLVKRYFQGEKLSTPHRQHFYQRLVTRLGKGHGPVLLGQYGLMLACAISVILPLWKGLDYNGVIPVLWGLLYLLLIWRLEMYLQALPPADTHNRK